MVQRDLDFLPVQITCKIKEVGLEQLNRRVETYFFDFAGDLYGQEIEIALQHYLRPEEKFATLDALTAQMARDCEQAKALLQR